MSARLFCERLQTLPVARSGCSVHVAASHVSQAVQAPWAVTSRAGNPSSSAPCTVLRGRRLCDAWRWRGPRSYSTSTHASLRQSNLEEVFLEANRLTNVAHSLWSRLVRVGDTVVDATIGNGHDTAVMAELALRTHGEGEAGRVVGFDLQPSALEATRARLQKLLTQEELRRVELYQKSHSLLSEHVSPGTVKLVAFNTGYLPGVQDGKLKTATKLETTVQAVKCAAEALTYGGAVSILGYTGHDGGAEEVAAIEAFAAGLDPSHWTVSRTALINRDNAPVLILIYKKRIDQQPKAQRPDGGAAASPPPPAEE